MARRRVRGRRRVARASAWFSDPFSGQRARYARKPSARRTRVKRRRG